MKRAAIIALRLLFSPVLMAISDQNELISAPKSSMETSNRHDDSVPVDNGKRTILQSGYGKDESARSGERSLDWGDWVNETNTITIDGNASDWYGNYTAHPIGKNMEDVDLYIANDDEKLYICLDVRSDTLNETSVSDHIEIYFDGDNNDDVRLYDGTINQDDRDSFIRITGNSSAPPIKDDILHGNSAGYIIKGGGGQLGFITGFGEGPGYHDYLKQWKNNGDYDHFIGFNGTPSHRVYEVAISLDKWDWTPGSSIGGCVLVGKNTSQYDIGEWPPDMWFTDVSTWKDFNLAGPPFIKDDAPTQFNVTEDEADQLELNTIFGDPDGDTLTFVMDNNSQWTENFISGMADYTVRNQTLSIEPLMDAFGSEEVKIRGTDENDHSAFFNLTVNVEPVNDPPCLKSINGTDIDGGIISITAHEDRWEEIVFQAEDVDDDELSYHINIDEVIPDLIEDTDYFFSENNGTFRIRPMNGHVGDYEIEITVEDGNGSEDSISADLEIINTNDPPIIMNIDDQYVDQDQWLEIVTRATDEDSLHGDILTFHTNFTGLFDVPPDGKNFEFSNETGEFRFKPNHTMVREFHTYVEVRDAGGAMDRTEFEITVINVNDPPEEPAFVYNITENSLAVSFTVGTVKDWDGDELTYTWDFGDRTPKMMGVETDHTYETGGEFTVKLTVTDGNGGSSNTTRTIVLSIPKFELRGRVADENNVSIAGAEIKIRDESTDELYYELTSDPNGTFIQVLTIGEYTLVINRSGFKPFTKSISVKDKEIDEIYLLTPIHIPDDDDDVPPPDEEEGFLSSFGISGKLQLILGGVIILFMIIVILLIIFRRRTRRREDTYLSGPDASEPSIGEGSGSASGIDEFERTDIEHRIAVDDGGRSRPSPEIPVSSISGKDGAHRTMLCKTCGQPSGYYPEYDCFWCESCQDYVYSEIPTGISKEDVSHGQMSIEPITSETPLRPGISPSVKHTYIRRTRENEPDVSGRTTQAEKEISVTEETPPTGELPSPSTPASTPQPIPRGPQIVGVDTEFAVSDLFLIYVDGRLIKSVFFETQLREGMDEDIMSGMLTAITDFIKDSFSEESGALKTLQYGKMTIFLERGVGMYLAVVFHGSAPPELREKMRWLLIRLWKKYKYKLKVWDGSYDGLDGIDLLLNGLMEQTELGEGAENEGSALPQETGDACKAAEITTAMEAVRCGICMGVVKPGLEIITCPCGSRSHLTCAERVINCPSCACLLVTPSSGGETRKLPEPVSPSAGIPFGNHHRLVVDEKGKQIPAFPRMKPTDSSVGDSSDVPKVPSVKSDEFWIDL